MAETATTTRPARSRTSKPAAAKATPAKAAPAKAAEAAPEVEARTDVDSFIVKMEHVGTTKQYEKFAAPENMRGVVVGYLYGPLGTQRMAVKVIGAGAPDDDE